MTELISIQECKEIISKAINIDVNTANIKYELSSIENSFGYIGDFARLSIYFAKVILLHNEFNFVKKNNTMNHSRKATKITMKN